MSFNKNLKSRKNTESDREEDFFIENRNIFFHELLRDFLVNVKSILKLAEREMVKKCISLGLSKLK